MQLEEERRALAAFVTKFDSLGLGITVPAVNSKLNPPMPTPGGASAAFSERQLKQKHSTFSPIRLPLQTQPSLLEQLPEEDWNNLSDASFEMDDHVGKSFGAGMGRRAQSPVKEVLSSGKENLPGRGW